MLRKKLAATLVLALGLALAMLPSATGQTKKGSVKKAASTADAKKGSDKKGGASAAGAKLFAEHCATCHDGGGNSIEAEKTLKTDALKANGFKSPADIQTRIKEGKGIMPAFDGQLKANEMQQIAAYVWAQAQKDWK